MIKTNKDVKPNPDISTTVHDTNDDENAPNEDVAFDDSVTEVTFSDFPESKYL
jgi:hypothetical protein